jgi:hypothetical protein
MSDNLIILSMNDGTFVAGEAIGFANTLCTLSHPMEVSIGQDPRTGVNNLFMNFLLPHQLTKTTTITYDLVSEVKHVLDPSDYLQKCYTIAIKALETGIKKIEEEANMTDEEIVVKRMNDRLMKMEPPTDLLQ